jgi:glycosyltransferase involved in cell wall biosynthesis
LVFNSTVAASAKSGDDVNLHTSDPEFTFEIIVVSDGSKDKTAAIVNKNYVKKYGSNSIRVLDLQVNRGKGGAVKRVESSSAFGCY